MKILIVSYDEPVNIPYIKYYEEAIVNAGGMYNCVFWQRSEEKVFSSLDSHIQDSYIFQQKYKHSGLLKVFNLLSWRRFTLSIIEKENYDKIVILTTVPGVLLVGCLLKNFKQQYWFDVRDYTFENLNIYKRIVIKLISNSYKTSISSQRFSSFISGNVDNKIINTHNILNISDECRCFCKPGKPIVIGYLGGIRYYDLNLKVINALKNNKNFELRYYGIEHNGCALKCYVEENSIENVHFYGKYDNIEKKNLYQNIDIINCIYGNNSNVEKLALPNKLYDAVLFKKPIIVSSGTYLAEIVSKYSLGIVINEVGNIDDAVKEYFNQMNPDEFCLNCNVFLEKVKKEIAYYISEINHFVSN